MVDNRANQALKDVEVMVQKQIFYLTLACDLDLKHINMGDTCICNTLSCYGGHLCQVLRKSSKG